MVNALKSLVVDPFSRNMSNFHDIWAFLRRLSPSLGRRGCRLQRQAGALRPGDPRPIAGPGAREGWHFLDAVDWAWFPPTAGCLFFFLSFEFLSLSLFVFFYPLMTFLTIDWSIADFQAWAKWGKTKQFKSDFWLWEEAWLVKELDSPPPHLGVFLLNIISPAFGLGRTT